MADWRPLADWRGRSPSVARLVAGLLSAGVEASRSSACLFVPGRIELFGKHTDYAGGRSLVLATDRGLSLLVAPRDDGIVHWRDLVRGVETRFSLARPDARPGHWSNYLRSVARRVATDFGPFAAGADVAMVSDLPAAAGLSSSSALVVAAFLAFEAANPVAGLPAFGRDATSREDLADYLGATEAGAPFAETAGGGGVGTFGGSEDHVAILCSRRGCARQYRFDPVELEREVSLDPRWRLVVGGSGVHADKTGKARERFNRLSHLAAVASRAWRRSSGGEERHLAAALIAAGDPEALLERVLEVIPATESEAIGRRVRHFCVESDELVPAAATALATADGGALGLLAERSQDLARRWLGNQVEETSALVRLARERGAFAASAFGAGFGGAVWALVERETVAGFVGEWRRAYTAVFPRHREASEFFATGAGRGARWLPANGEEAERR